MPTTQIQQENMALNEADLIKIYPRLWHVAEDGSWPSISRHGLLSTSSLLDLYEINGERRFEIESRKRLVCHTISRAGLPDAIVRDQKPMSDAKLRNCQRSVRSNGMRS
jgi:hypothetical protein